MLSRSKENILSDFFSLIVEMDKKIAELAQYARQQSSTSKTSTNELNVLKLERIKLKEQWATIHAMEETEVLAQQELFETHYDASKKVLEQPSVAMQ